MDQSSQGEERTEANEGFSPSAEMPTVSVMRSRVIFGLALGVVGICLGVVGVVFSSPWVAVGAAACAVVACFVIGGIALTPLFQQKKDGGSVEVQDRIDNVLPRVDTDSPAGVKADKSVIDPVTDLPDARFFEVAVEGRVAAARRHLWPVSIVLLQLGFDAANDGKDVHNRSLATFANMMRQTLREADIACRLDDNTFGLILEDTSEEGGVWTAERLQIALSHDATNIRKLVAGVAAYPTHGLFAKDVLVRAQAALSRASSTPAGHGLGQVEVAHVDLS